MTEQRKRMEKTLCGCAEMGVPDTVDLWPAIRERVTAKPSRSRRPFRLVPHTRVGWVFATLLVMFFGMGAYAAPVVYDVFQEALPGSTGRDVGTEIGQEQTGGGARVILEYAYADARFVVVGYTLQEMNENRTVEGLPTELSPLHIDDTTRTPEEEAAELPPRVDLTDGSGQDFDLLNGSVTYSADDPDDLMQPRPNVAIFAASEGLEPGERHRFRLNIALEEEPIFPPDWEGEIEAPPGGWANVGPFAFDFEVPVRPVPAFEVGQEATANGATLTLERVVNSPGRPQAIVCVESPNDDYVWYPSTAPTGFQRDEPLPVDQLGGDNGDCWSLTLDEPLEGRSSVTVTELLGEPRTDPQTGSAVGAGAHGPLPEIRGPWTFEFEAPEQ